MKRYYLKVGFKNMALHMLKFGIKLVEHLNVPEGYNDIQRL